MITPQEAEDAGMPTLKKEIHQLEKLIDELLSSKSPYASGRKKSIIVGSSFTEKALRQIVSGYRKAGWKVTRTKYQFDFEPADEAANNNRS